MNLQTNFILVALQTQAALCEFSEREKELMMQILIGTRHSRLRRCGLQEQEWRLKDLLEAGRNYELAETHASAIEQETSNKATVNRFSKPFSQSVNRTV